ALGAAARWALMRSSSRLACSSFGSCGTNSPLNALARQYRRERYWAAAGWAEGPSAGTRESMLWVRWSIRFLAEATLASSWSAQNRRERFWTAAGWPEG